MANESVRTIDALKSTVDVLSLNNTIVSLRVPLKKTKVRVIHKLVHQIQMYRKRKGSNEHIVANERKCERLLKEIEEIKKLDHDKVLKFALGNTKTLCDITLQNDLEMKAMVRLATHKLITQEVQKWRAQHSDWPSLAAFVMQHTSRRLKKKKKKMNGEREISQNKGNCDSESSSEEGTDSDISDKEQVQNSSNCSDSEDEDTHIHERTKNSKSKTNLAKMVKKDKERHHRNDEMEKVSPNKDSESNTGDNADNPHRSITNTCSYKITMGKDSIEKKENLFMDETEGFVKECDSLGETESTKLKPSEYVCAGEVLVKRINLHDLEDESQLSAEEGDVNFLFRETQLKRTRITMQDADQVPKALKMKRKRDDFFLGNAKDEDETSSSENESTGEVEEEEAVESKMKSAKKKMMVESTFLGCLSAMGSKMRNKNKKVDHASKKNSSYPTSLQQTRKPHAKQFTKSYDKTYDKNSSKGKSGKSLEQSRKVNHESTEAQSKQNAQTEKKLHPSWEASLKRKREQSALTKFQGTKIKFDD